MCFLNCSVFSSWKQRYISKPKSAQIHLSARESCITAYLDPFLHLYSLRNKISPTLRSMNTLCAVGVGYVITLLQAKVMTSGEHWHAFALVYLGSPSINCKIDWFSYSGFWVFRPNIQISVKNNPTESNSGFCILSKNMLGCRQERSGICWLVDDLLKPLRYSHPIVLHIRFLVSNYDFSLFLLFSLK